MKFCKDNQLSAVLNYKELPFNREYSVNGFIIRVIELYRLYSMKAQIEAFGCMVAGVRYVPPSHEEINSLIRAGVVYSSQLDGELISVDGQIKSIDHEIEVAQSDAKKYGGTSKAKQMISELEHRRTLRYEDRLAKSKKTDNFLRLIALLRIVAEGAADEVKELIDFRTLNQAEKAPPFSVRYNMPPQQNQTPDATEYAWRMLDEYSNALSGILKKVALSADKFEISRGANQKAVFYREYFSQPEDGQIKMTITADEYADHMFGLHKTQLDKLKKMNEQN